MKHRIIFGVIKTYEGMLGTDDRYMTNTQIIIIQMSNKFLLFYVVGSLNKNEHYLHLIYEGDNEKINQFMEDYEEEDKFIQMEESLCDIPNENYKDTFKVILKKKGKHLNGHFTFKKVELLWNNNVYLMEGKFTPLYFNKIENETVVKICIGIRSDLRVNCICERR